MSEIVVGQKVKVMNQRIDGSSFLEGEAIVTKVHEDMKNGMFFCDVRFEGDDEDVLRWIDVESQ